MPLLGAAGLLLAGCGSGPPHSDYFIVTFLPGTPAPSQPGLEALGNAVAAAERSRPRFIAIASAEPAGEAEPGLEKQRTDAVSATFGRAGIDPHLIRIEPRPVTETGYEERKDGLVIRLAYGDLPHP